MSAGPGPGQALISSIHSPLTPDHRHELSPDPGPALSPDPGHMLSPDPQNKNLVMDGSVTSQPGLSGVVWFCDKGCLRAESPSTTDKKEPRSLSLPHCFVSSQLDQPRWQALCLFPRLTSPGAGTEPGTCSGQVCGVSERAKGLVKSKQRFFW